MFGWSVYADKSSKFIHSSLCVSLLCYFSSSFTVAAMCSRFFVLWYMKYHRIISWCDGTIMSGEWLRCFIVIFWKTKDGQTTKAPAKRRKFLNEFVGILVHSFQVGCYKNLGDPSSVDLGIYSESHLSFFVIPKSLDEAVIGAVGAPCNVLQSFLQIILHDSH